MKFRIWDGTKMVDSGGTPSMLSGFFKQTAALNTAKYYEYQQSTGLESRNGVEIYEGDIVARHNGKWLTDELYEVRNTGWSFTLYDGSKPSLLSHYISPDQLEVIGNTYETPDLVVESNR